jgi:hypothetical protein
VEGFQSWAEWGEICWSLREVLELLLPSLIGHTDIYWVNIGEYIEFGDRDFREAVDASGIAE